MSESILLVNISMAYTVIAIVLVSTAPGDWNGKLILKGVVGLLWPLWAAILLVIAPFLAVGWLGEKLGNWVRAGRNGCPQQR